MESSRHDSAEPWLGNDVPALAAARRAARAVVPSDAKFKLYFRMLDTPVLSELYIGSRGRLRHRRLQQRTRVVIEAFPSSGSTYCRQAFLLSNPDVAANDICSHTHAPRVVERAVRAGVPCIVVARDPRDAVSSTVQRFGVRTESAFAYYHHYYSKLAPIKDRFVVAPFSTVIGDFSVAIAQCNERYGVDFTTTSQAGVSSDVILADIDRRSQNRHGGTVKEERVSRPTAARRSSEEFLRGLTSRQRRVMDRAVATYEGFVA